HCAVKNGKAVATGSSASGGGGSGKKGSSSSGSAATSTAGTNIGTGTAPGATGPVTGGGGNLAGDHSHQGALAALTRLGIVLAVALPPGLAVWLRRRRGQARG